MKYEDWIKYEEIRLSLPKDQAGVVWIAGPTDNLPSAPHLTVSSTDDDDSSVPGLWTIIIHYLNSQKI